MFIVLYCYLYYMKHLFADLINNKDEIVEMQFHPFFMLVALFSLKVNKVIKKRFVNKFLKNNYKI